MRYPSKLLLFGEYTVIQGGEALAIPYPRFGGTWIRIAPEDNPHLSKLLEFAAYLGDLKDIVFDTQALVHDLNNDFGFLSDIPTGYGLGSSGALCAAIYANYALNKLDATAENATELRLHFAAMENFFHGNSSGVDPLICYLRRPLYMKGRTHYESISLPLERPKLFLLDTQIERSAKPLIDYYTQASKEDVTFQTMITTQLLPAVHEVIKAYQSNQVATFELAFRQISQLQRAYFQPMIPLAFRQLWDEGLESGNYMLKICGAGGGGFILAYGQVPSHYKTLAV